MFRPASQIVPRPMDWLWPGRLALGKLSMLEGDPGSAKSYLALDLCARLSTGRPAPDEAPMPGPASAIFLNGEDGDEDTFRPRLVALGADLERVVSWDAREASLQLPSNIKWLDEAVARHQAKLVVIDTLLAFLDPGVTVSSSHSVRSALAPLRALAVKHGCCILVLRHLIKRMGGRALYRGEGAIGIGALCRSTWLAACHPRLPAQFVLAQVKNNIAAPQPSLIYSLEARPDAADAPAVARWHGPCPLGAEELHGARLRRSRRHRAAELLKALLKDGPRTSREIWDASRRHRLAQRTLERARQDLEVACVRVGPPMQQTVYWLLPGQQLPPHLKEPDDTDLSPWIKPLEEKYPKPNPLDE